jgi:hypothetical protein
MAYMDQEKKAKIAPEVKRICAKYGVKGSLSVDHHTSLILTIKSGVLDFIGNANAVLAQDPRALAQKSQPLKDYIQVNTYWYHEHFTGVVKEFLGEVINAMNDGNWNKSDIQSDYFNVGWYLNINVGRWNKPYELVK